MEPSLPRAEVVEGCMSLGRETFFSIVGVFNVGL
jgi:hypothetical protein